MSQFQYYKFVCGNGFYAMCNKTVGLTCLAECTLFKGYTLAKGKAGVAAIRNVTFIPGYQSPIQASDKNLDFIVAFYHDGVFVSASLINAYTLKS